MATMIAAEMNEIIAQLANRAERVTLADFSNKDMYAAAMQYAQTYRGEFVFMVSMMEQVACRGQWLTNNQAVAVMNCAVAEYKRNHKAAVVAEAVAIVATTGDTTKQYVADGWYTIVGPKGGHRTLRLQTVEATEKQPKVDGVKQWLAYLSGSDNNSDYTTVGFVHGNTVKLFAKNEGKFADIVAAARFLVKNGTKTAEFGKAYAASSGKCYVCNRKLTTPESIAAGIGPVCAAK